MPERLQLKEQSQWGCSQSRVQRHNGPCAQDRRAVESKCLLCCHCSRGGQRMVRTTAEWISGQSLYGHVIICTVSHSPSTVWPYYPVNLRYCTQQNDSAPDFRGCGVRSQRGRLSRHSLIKQRHLIYIHMERITYNGFNMSKGQTRFAWQYYKHFNFLFT